jgi:hypothetical protein
VAGHAAASACPAGGIHCAVPLTDVPEMRRSGLMQARALAFLIPEDGIDPKLIGEWRAKIICACALDAQFREAFFAALHQVMAEIEALAAALRKPSLENLRSG